MQLHNLQMQVDAAFAVPNVCGLPVELPDMGTGVCTPSQSLTLGRKSPTFPSGSRTLAFFAFISCIFE